MVLDDKMSEDRNLTMERGVIKGKITRIINFIASVKETDQYDDMEIRVRSSELTTLMEKFDEIQTTIELQETDSTKHPIHEAERLIEENRYYTTKATISRLLRPINIHHSTFQDEHNTVMMSTDKPRVTTVRLPQLELPTFSGDIQEWPAFKNQFECAMENVPPLQRLQYLKSALKGEAAALISSLLITEANYAKAMNILKNAYENKTIVVNHHINNFMSHPTINRSNIKSFLSVFQQSFDSLSSLKLPVEQWDTLLVYIISQKLDNSLRGAWEVNRKQTSVPTMQELLDFMRQRATAFTILSEKTSDKSPHYKFQTKVSHVSTSDSSSYNTVCTMCQGQHQLYQCPHFLDLSVDKRIDYIKANSLCYNCLQVYKLKHKCSKRKCSICNGKHHSLIHLTNPPRKVNIATATNINSSQIHSSHIPSHNLTNIQMQSTPSPIHIDSHMNNQNLNMQQHKIQSNTNITSNIPTQTCVPSIQPTQTCVPSIQQNTYMHPTGQCDMINNNKSTHYIDQQNVQQNILSTPSTVCVSNANSNQTLLSTALIKVQDSSGNWHSARALLDSGSEVNIVTHRLATKLNSKFYYSNHIIQGIGESGKQTQLCINTNIGSRLSDYSSNLNFIVMDKITVPLPHNYINTSTWNIPSKQGKLLADPHFYIPGDIDMLIGAELFYSLLLTNRIRLGPHRPQLIETVFGWVITGNITSNTNEYQSSHSHVSLHIACQTSNTDDLLVRFWQQEEINTKQQIVTPEQKYCEQLFLDTTVQEESGHFTVTMPMQSDKIQELGNSFNIAYRNLLILESKFRKNPQLYTQYKQFIDEFINLGHAEYIPDFQQQHYQPQCYLPHLGVLRPDSRTTKLRTVVNASSKTTTGVSLNDILYEGPNIYNDVLDILLRFRMNKYAFSCDIIKMFRTIFVSEEQRPFLRILWRNSENEPLKCIQLKTVTYGTKCAPYLACRTLRHLATIYEKDYPLAAEVVKSECYMDDFLCGGSSIEETQNTCKQLVQLLDKGNFKLHKWTTNEPKVLEYALQSEHSQSNDTKQHTQTNNTYDLSPNDVIKTLGIKWLPHSDLFSVAVPDPKEFKFTKRNVLSVLAQIYDPIGILAPTTITAKILMQDIWKLKIEWDSILPNDIQSRWSEYYEHITHLQNINIPRYYFTDIPTETVLVGFCDASQKAYGACLYLRGTYPNKESSCTLVMSKTKVAPIKTQSLPRLELCGALLLSQLVKRLFDAYNNRYKIDKTFLYTDSLIVLHWIKSPYKKLHTYVSHRLMEIIELTKDNMWNYVNTKTNPADLLTRGVTPQSLGQLKIWWNGPQWLTQDPTSWPSSIPQDNSDTYNQTEMVSAHLSTTSTNNQGSELYDYCQKFSNFNKLTRTIAYVFRFVNNIRNKNNQHSHLTTSELNYAQNFIIGIIQKNHFSKEIQELQDINLGTQKSNTSSYIFKSSPLRKLNPFLDGNNLLRIGGRIQNSNIPFNHAHPIILPQKEHITSLIIEQYHLRLLHSGIQNTLCNIRLKFWPINGRNEVKKVIHRCVRCIRFSAQTCEQQMGTLPAPRVSLVRAFTHVGVDFSGAIHIRSSMTRNCKYIKGYICLFICMSTKALHLELVTELTTNAFLCALKRLISRRGICQRLYSDNATNFKGAHNELNELYKMFKNDDTYRQILDFCNTNSIDWKFTVPLASHMGGLYEAGIKSVKSLFKKHLGNVKLTYELLYTVLVQIEGVLNSRPLCSLKDVPENDIACLTPAHFLIGAPISDIPEPNVLGILENRLSLYQKMSQIKQKIWSQFYNNYLSELQPRSKWLQMKANLKIGDVVILKEDITPPACWPLGRVISVNKNSKDNLVRSVIVKTFKGEFMRPINKLVLLPCN